MRVLLATHSLAMPGGSETYLLTVAGGLLKLGHEVEIFTFEAGQMSEAAAEGGLRVATSEQELGSDYEAIIAQDGATSYALAERLPSTPQLFVAHTADFPLQYPPQVSGVVGAVVVMNDRVQERLEALASRPKLIRLRQPIDTRRFQALGDLPPRPRTMLVLSNYLHGERLQLLEEAARRSGMGFSVVGRSGAGELTLAPEEELRTSDVVIACGRAALEAMSCGRAVYVFGHLAADGWVTPESYAKLESDGFAGLASNRGADGDSLRADLEAYGPEMGIANRSLVVRHHDAGAHVAELVAALRELGPERRLEGAEGTLREMSRLVRVQWETEVRTLSLEHQLRQAAEERRIGDEALAGVRREYATVVGARRYRVMQALMRPFESLRERLLPRRGP